jgi:predicted enzyme related to lactoylglutathione lyase
MLVRGIGGVFIQARDPTKLRDWYAAAFQLPLESDGSGGAYVNFPLIRDPAFDRSEMEVFAIHPAADPAQPPARWTLNLRVADLAAVLSHLKQLGIEPEWATDYSYGRFAFIQDPEGHGIELYEPL